MNTSAEILMELPFPSDIIAGNQNRGFLGWYGDLGEKLQRRLIDIAAVRAAASAEEYFRAGRHLQIIEGKNNG